MLEIKRYPDPILFDRMPEFNFLDPILDPKQLEKEMIETMFQNNGIGLSANQVGIRTRVFVMGSREEPHLAQAFFNPLIVSWTDSIEDMPEGCLSFPKIFVKIKRPTAIKAKWQNSSGEWMEGEFQNYNCKCFLHELDHLEGITFRDRVSALKWSLAVKKSNKRN
jgi:peptide deformylase